MQRQAVQSALGRSRPDICRAADLVRASARPFSTSRPCLDSKDEPESSHPDDGPASGRERSRVAAKKLGDLLKQMIATTPNAPGPVIDASALKARGQSALREAVGGLRRPAPGDGALANAINVRSLPQSLQGRNPFVADPAFGRFGDDNPFRQPGERGPTTRPGRGGGRGGRGGRGGGRGGRPGMARRGKDGGGEGTFQRRRRAYDENTEDREGFGAALGTLNIEKYMEDITAQVDAAAEEQLASDKEFVSWFRQLFAQQYRVKHNKSFAGKYDALKQPFLDELSAAVADVRGGTYRITAEHIRALNAVDIEQPDPEALRGLVESTVDGADQEWEAALELDRRRDAEREVEFKARLEAEQKPHEVDYNYNPDTTLESLRGYAQPLALDSPLAAAGTVMANLRALAWREPYAPGVMPVSAREMRKRMGRQGVLLLSEPDEERARLSEECGREVGAADEAVRRAITERAVKGKYDDVAWTGIEDVVGAARVYKRMDGTYGNKDVKLFEGKLLELLRPQGGKGTRAEARKRA